MLPIIRVEGGGDPSCGLANGATVFASALSAANAGVAVVEAGALSSKARKQLAEALALAVRLGDRFALWWGCCV